MDPKVIRQYVDGELTPEQAAAFERQMDARPELQAVVVSEQRLRERVGRIMRSDVAAPAELAATVRESLSRGRLVEPAQGATPAQCDDGAISSSAADPADAEATPTYRLFRNPTKANVFAVAASIALVAGAVLLGIFGPPLLQHRYEGPTINVRLMGEAAVMADNEHDRCVLDPAARRAEMRFRTPEAVRTNLAGLLGGVPPVFDLSAAGMELVGGGMCSLPPAPDHTAHVLYERPGGEVMLSVFMQPDAGQFGELDPGQVYTPRHFGTVEDEPICVFSDGSLVYIVSACVSDDLERAMPRILRQAGLAPADGR